ncbi:MAG TPA: J domain-containing protein [Chthoniobacter sp.]|jgi:hypothetical protein
MKSRIVIFALLILLVGVAAHGQTSNPEQWQARAVQKYPALGVQGSDFNQRFIAEYNRRQATRPDFFTDPKWPMTLADEVAAGAGGGPWEVVSGEFLGWWNRLPPDGRVAAMIASAGFGLALLLSLLGKYQRWSRWRHICKEWDSFFAMIERIQALAIVPSHIELERNEHAFFCAASALYETRALRDGRPRKPSFRVAKGMWISETRGRSLGRQEWAMIDSGMLTVTNHRIVFDGLREARSIPLQRVLTLTPMRDSVDIEIENRQKNMAFIARNPLILASIMRLARDGCEALPAEDYQRRGNADTQGARSSQTPPPPPPKQEGARRPSGASGGESEEASHAAVLGLSGVFTAEDLKRRYHDRIKEYHPDKVAALGPKLREVAETESKKINAAYQYLLERFPKGRNQ